MYRTQQLNLIEKFKIGPTLEFVQICPGIYMLTCNEPVEKISKTFNKCLKKSRRNISGLLNQKTRFH